MLKSKEIELPTEEDIQDRSKSDSLAKALVLIQTGWFIIQCIVRWIEHLPLTQLEITTLAYAAVNFGIYLAWWDKPRNVNSPVRVVKVSRLNGSSASLTRPKDEASSDFNDPDGWNEITFERLLDTFCGKDVGLSALESLDKVPALYSGGPKASDIGYSDIVAAIMGIAFGVIHCIAWPFDFPSNPELILWRISSMAVAGLVVILLLMVCLEITFRFPLRVVMKGIFLPWMMLYTVGRITQLVLSFTTLRSLPLGAYQSIQWTNFIPHIGT